MQKMHEQSIGGGLGGAEGGWGGSAGGAGGEVASIERTLLAKEFNSEDSVILTLRKFIGL